MNRWVWAVAAAGSVSPPVSVRSESQAARIIRLEAELAVSRAEQVKLETERDILRQAAKYFAGETNWTLAVAGGPAGLALAWCASTPSA